MKLKERRRWRSHTNMRVTGLGNFKNRDLWPNFHFFSSKANRIGLVTNGVIESNRLGFILVTWKVTFLPKDFFLTCYGSSFVFSLETLKATGRLTFSETLTLAHHSSNAFCLLLNGIIMASLSGSICGLLIESDQKFKVEVFIIKLSLLGKI